MAKAKNPITFAKHFGIPESRLRRLGVMNPTLALDTPLFIDPLLLGASRHREMPEAAQTFEAYFDRVVRLLDQSRSEGDVAWRNALRLFEFHEIPGTCIGYGTGSVYGNALGAELTKRLVRTAREIIAIGVNDPDLFLALALFEDDIGPDRISDLTANVVLGQILDFNERILGTLSVDSQQFELKGRSVELPVNPFTPRPTPVILLPTDVLRELPIALDWDDIGRAAAESEAIRGRVNDHVGAIWEAKTRRDKAAIRHQALASKAAFDALLEAMHAVSKASYDATSDPAGILGWATVGSHVAEVNPLAIQPPAETLDGLHGVVRAIVKQFRHLVEKSGLNKNLWHDGKRLIERHAQLLFFAVAYSYCKANDLDVSPEVDAGNGEIDFKFSRGFRARVVLEVKLSTNSNVLPGYTHQLEAYKAAQETERGVYLVIDVGGMGNKDKRLIEIRNEAAKRGEPVSDLEFVDGRIPPSASKRREAR